MQVDDALVDTELVSVPSLGTLTVGGLSGGDLKNLGGESDGALGGDLARSRLGEVLGTGKDVRRDCNKLVFLIKIIIKKNSEKQNGRYRMKTT